MNMTVWRIDGKVEIFYRLALHVYVNAVDDHSTLSFMTRIIPFSWLMVFCSFLFARKRAQYSKTPEIVQAEVQVFLNFAPTEHAANVRWATLADALFSKRLHTGWRVLYHSEPIAICDKFLFARKRAQYSKSPKIVQTEFQVFLNFARAPHSSSAPQTLSNSRI